MNKMWTQATQGSALGYRQGRRLKIIIGGRFIVVNSSFTELKCATHTQSEQFLRLVLFLEKWKDPSNFLPLSGLLHSLSSGVLPTEMSMKQYR